MCIYIFICPELENVIGLPGVFIYLFCFQASKNFFFSSQYCDPYKRSSLGGLYMQSLTDNIYISEKFLKAQKDAKMACKEGKWNSHNSHLYETKKRNVYLLPWGSFHTVPHLLRSFLFFCSTSVQGNLSHVYKCWRCMWNNSIQSFHVFVGVLDMYTLNQK